MLSEKMQDALNRQINAELYSAYLYASMAAWFQSVGLRGCAGWMSVQTREETFHAMKFFNFVQERNGVVKLTALDAPPAAWESPLAAFKDAYQHELKVTGLINSLVDLALAESDHASNIFLQWFVTEQVEEEASVDEVVQQLKLVGEAGPGLFMIDKDLGARQLGPLVSAALTGAPAPA
ncbi:MAG: ferritin [Pseudomonadota bacterium]